MKDDRRKSATPLACMLLCLLGSCEGRHQPSTPDRPTAKISGIYSKNCPNAPRSWQKTGKLAKPFMLNVVGLDSAADVTWNGTPATIENLRDYLHKVDAAPASELIFIPKPGAQCSEVQAIRNLMSSSATCRGQGACLEGEKHLPPPIN